MDPFTLTDDEPSHYEVALVEQLPPHIPRAVRLAARISHLPLELVEPIIKDLPLFRVLELLACGPALEGAVECSPAWSWLFEGRVTRMKRMWASLNRLAWLWCRTKYMCVADLPQRTLRLSSSELQKNAYRLRYGDHNMTREQGERVVGRLAYDVVLGLRRLLGCDFCDVRPSRARRGLFLGFSIPQIRALSFFLPATILSAVKEGSAPRLQEALLNAQLPQSAEDCLRDAEDSAVDVQVSCCELGRRDLWTVDSANRFLPFLAQAYKLLNESYSAELLCMAELYERFPGKLKAPFAPQTPPKNPSHVPRLLRQDAQRVLTKPLRNFRKIWFHDPTKGIFSKGGSYRFRYPDTNLIPFNWCFILYQAVQRQHPLSTSVADYPEALLPSLTEVQAGLRMIHHRHPHKRFEHLLERVDTTGMPNIQRLESIIKRKNDYVPFQHYVAGAPRPLRELSWLKSFMLCVEWMETEFPALASACQALGECTSSPQMLDLGSNVVFPPLDLAKFYSKFANGAPAEVIARCMLRDSIVCDKDQSAAADHAPLPVPSGLALRLPEFSSPRGREIARFLLPSPDEVGVDAQRLRYDSLKEKLVRHLRQAPRLKGHGDGYRLVCETGDGAADDEMKGITYTITGQTLQASLDEADDPSYPTTGVPETDVDIAAKVLRDLLETSLQPGASAADALDMLKKLSLHPVAEPTTTEQPLAEEKTTTWDETVKGYLAARPAASLPGNDGLPRCYICRLVLHVPHKTSPSLCIPCGDFNQAGSALSMPGALDLSGKTALVTGARVNLGYHVALRLLRCGARVVASTRYPRDAVRRYEAEADSAAWIDRLKVVGADFRSARDAFELVAHVRNIIATWGGRLDILVNNAAQTLTDSVEAEEGAVQKERKLLGDTPASTRLLIPPQQYQARVRGGTQALIEGPASGFSRDMVSAADGRSSWVQSITDIPYEDVISAHSVNTFVPLILIRELLPLMGSPPSKSPSPPRSPSSSSSSSSKRAPIPPAGYIINVSSREGIFESSRANAHKNGKHVHTNMSKAALNMITETEAGPAWAARRVAMNTVDPGYMSAAPELENAYGGVRPIGWEDGAGRVLWPVAVGEGVGGGGGSGVVWGRFLKHYGAVRVEPGWGRG